MKVLVTGVNGQLGYDVIKCLKSRDIDCEGADIEQFDITDFIKTREYIIASNPDIIVHCSAYTAVDKAEEEKEKCELVNVDGAKNIAIVCKEVNAKMVYISTDYVFPGTGDKFYEVSDETVPLSQYGKTKLLGEKAVIDNLSKYFIVRISWVYGINGSNFVKTMLRLSKERDEINVVADQLGSPTYTADVAPLICDMIMTERYGIYHATNEGVCSWAEFARKIFEYVGLDTRVNEINSEDYKSKVARPKNSRLSKQSLDINGFHRLPDWADALKRYIKELEVMG